MLLGICVTKTGKKTDGLMATSYVAGEKKEKTLQCRNQSREKEFVK